MPGVRRALQVALLLWLPCNAVFSAAPHWRDVDTPARTDASSVTARWLHVDATAVRGTLARLPRTQTLRLRWPSTDGGEREFDVQWSGTVPDALVARHPGLGAWRGSEVGGGPAQLRLESSSLGVSAMVFDRDAIEWMARDRRSGLYRLSNQPALRNSVWRCGVVDARPHAHAKRLHAAPKAVGATLRTYRAAIATTGEYTQARGGVEAALASVVSATNRINQVFENELGLRLQLVDDNDALILADAASDGYSNADPFAMLGQNQARLDAQLGSAGYDVGHAFSTASGGYAQLGSSCAAGLKAQGVSGTPFAPDDLFWIDLVAHEFGHQFGAEHSFNGSVGLCGPNREPQSAFEPGSGSTIMSYSGNCFDGTRNDNFQNFSDANFHARSLEQIHAYTQSTLGGDGGSCGVVTATGNAPPVVVAVAGATIPARTPFMLTASASDAPSDALTYSWEQYDLGPPSPPAIDDGARPLFRAFPPSASPTRLFPRLADILVGKGVLDFTPGELLPSTARMLTFRSVVRDNRAGGGGVQWSGRSEVPATQLTVVDTGAAFALTGFDTPRSIEAGVPQALSWTVAGTAAAPIACAQVELAWSRDDGATFPVLLAAATPNDGTHTVTVPGPATASGRFRARCTSSVFFDINNAPVALGADQVAPFVLSITRLDPSPAQQSPVRFRIVFSEAVAGVDRDDFALATSGTLNGVAIQGIGGGGDTWSVAVATGVAGSGSVRLDFVDDDTVRDDAGNPAGGAGAGNGGFTAGESYAVTPADFTGLLRDGFEACCG